MSAWFVWGFLPVIFWIATFFHLVRTQDYALSRKSQTAWLFLVIFFPLLGALAYWGFELPRRRERMRGPPPTGVA